MVIDDVLLHSYEMYSSSKAFNAANLTLNLGNNHFKNDMLSQLTSLFLHINRLSRLELSSIFSDSDWMNFAKLSDLPKLMELSFRYTNRQTFDYCHFDPFFEAKRTLTHLDLSSCGLTADDMIGLSHSLDHLLKLKKLTLDSNPMIGVKGLNYLDGVVEKSKVDILEITNCGISDEGIQLIVRWIYRLRSLDVSQNRDLRLSQTDIDKLSDILNNEKMPRRIILDDFRKESPAKIFGLSFQPNSQFSGSPFEADQ
ncbi:hypothetical protein BDF20DRAFT_432030 [Mycotypha africana]|uniref:uncharacterized protein n=1 Tax=Mycotypha africana TaxID=64632 RepID=UPI002301B472|nr:uncharacterized protein BDF20DRAFT_432030 [Mycotypha africana]KAI8981851.1 hypothetical protein BDF20DRAFT_432030 [Mycotypha africana]